MLAEWEKRKRTDTLGFSGGPDVSHMILYVLGLMQTEFVHLAKSLNTAKAPGQPSQFCAQTHTGAMAAVTTC